MICIIIFFTTIQFVSRLLFAKVHFFIEINGKYKRKYY